MQLRTDETLSFKRTCLPSAWADACATIVDTIDSPALPANVAQSLSTLLPFDEYKQIVYRKDAKPVMVYDNGLHPDGSANFVQDSYALHPFYLMYRTGTPAGVHRLRDLARLKAERFDLHRYRVSAVASEEIGYVTDGLPTGNEELCIGFEMPNGACGMIALCRRRTVSGFTPDEVDRVMAVVPFLTSVSKRCWHDALAKRPLPSAGSAVETEFAELDRLSPREREIARLLIKGHSTLSVSLRLGISTTTVKTHRKNLYSKLKIGTQFELFSLYADSLRRIAVSNSSSTSVAA